MPKDRYKVRDLHPSAGLSTAEASDFLGVTTRTLEKWRVDGSGPAFVRINQRLVRYRIKDLERFQDSRLVRSTADPGRDLAVEYPLVEPRLPEGRQ